MTEYTGTIQQYHDMLRRLYRGELALHSDSLVCALTTNGYSPDLAADTDLADISNELSGNGYARQTLTGVTVSVASGIVTLDANNVEFTASGGSLTARRWVLFDDTHVNDALLFTGLINAADVDVVAGDGLPIRVKFNAAGIIQHAAA